MSADHCQCWLNDEMPCCRCGDDSDGETAACFTPDAAPCRHVPTVARWVFEHSGNLTRVAWALATLGINPDAPAKPGALVADAEAADEIEILRSRLRSQGHIIRRLCLDKARQARKIHALAFAATGNPTPRIVKQIKQIRAAAGTNSVTKILGLIELGKLSDTFPQVSVPASFPRLAGSSVTVADRDTGGFPATSADVPGPAPTPDATPVPCRVSPIPAALPPRGGGANSQPEQAKESE